MSSRTVGVVFITHNAESHLSKCLPPVFASPLRPRVLVVNSSSNDGTVPRARDMGAETLVVPRKEFNHGVTRELARKHIGTEIVVMMTPDTYPISSSFLETLIKPISEAKAEVSYARQLPHNGADFFEAFPRGFNYPPHGHIRGIEDIGRYGTFTFFCSNSCAAWLNSALDVVGGFPTVLTAEDTITVARMLRHGFRIAYVAEAMVQHSHRYTLLQEFRRYFDTGYIRNLHKDMLLRENNDEYHGKQFIADMFRALVRRRPLALPYAVAQTSAKYLGYRLGFWGHNLPRTLVRKLSSQDYYWSSIHAMH